jgi:hypothetical protein
VSFRFSRGFFQRQYFELCGGHCAQA